MLPALPPGNQLSLSPALPSRAQRVSMAQRILADWRETVLAGLEAHRGSVAPAPWPLCRFSRWHTRLLPSRFWKRSERQDSEMREAPENPRSPCCRSARSFSGGSRREFPVRPDEAGILAANLAALSESNPALADRIQQSAPSPALAFRTARNGAAVPVLRGGAGELPFH